MTNKEALSAVVQVSVDDLTLEKALLDQGLNTGATYTSDKASTINLAAIDVLEGLLSRPNISEGGFTESFDRAAIQKRIDALKNKNGIVAGAVIRDASNKW